MEINNGIIKITASILLLGCCLMACAPKGYVTKDESDRIAKELEADERKIRDSFAEAEKAFNAGETDLAMEKFAVFAGKYPEADLADDAYFRMGEIFIKNDDVNSAVNSFEKVVTDYVGSDVFMEAKYRLALAYFKRGDYNDSIQSLRSLLENSLDKRRKVAVLSTIADAHLNLGKNMDALQGYEDALEEKPDEEVEKKIKKRVASIIENRLEKEELSQVPVLYRGSYIGEYGSYALIEGMVDEGNYEEGKKEINKFLSKTDRDEMTVKGKDLLQVIVQRMEVQANTIGCILPLSGNYEAYGKKVLQGVQLAAGVFGMSEGLPINLIIKDSMGDPDEAVKAVNELVKKERVVAIVGPLISSVAEASALKAQELGVPMIALSKKFGIPETGDYVFRNFLTNKHQTKTLARYVVNKLGIKRFAILYPRDSYGEELMNLFWNDINLLGGEIVGIEGYEPGQNDFGKEIKRLVGMDKVNAREEEEKPEEERLKPIIDFEAIFIPDSYEKAGLIAPHLAYNDVEGVRLLGTNSWNSPKLMSIGEGYVEGAIFPSGFYPGSMRESTLAFNTSFESSFGGKPDILEAMAYDATMMVVDIIKSDKARSRVEMRNSLLMLETFNGATGRTTVTEAGDVDKNIFILTVKKGEIVEVEDAQALLDADALKAEEIPLIQ